MSIKFILGSSFEIAFISIIYSLPKSWFIFLLFLLPPFPFLFIFAYFEKKERFLSHDFWISWLYWLIVRNLFLFLSELHTTLLFPQNQYIYPYESKIQDLRGSLNFLFLRFWGEKFQKYFLIFFFEIIGNKCFFLFTSNFLQNLNKSILFLP